ncbi:hypothetical protein EUGRSUZ_B00855 [Eucalyptus grandis]|uniref:Uncharacterized protein n=2 Tax=Eucalyptus grandis TaxID=71139 RepID=A0ACC3LP40_EUCGR|nr:hypothetical protein EUGRSUZ_B00855 [Eucalyptus grandis]
MIRDFWRRHRRKILFGAGILGSGYLLYKLYDGRKKQLLDLEKVLAGERENEELVKAHMQTHFESIQGIANTATMPHAMHYVSSRIAEELDLTHLTERLMRGKGQPNTLTSAEKLELWDQLKILSFTRMLVSLWAMTLLSLYIRVQVNILGRHLYIDTARGLGSPQLLDDADLIDMEDQQKFLASADFLSNHGLAALIYNMQAAAAEVLKGKQLRDFFDNAALHETILQILDTFMIMGTPLQWVGYLMPEDARLHKISNTSGNEDTIVPDFTKFDQLMVEARTVISSAEFGGVVDVSLKMVVHALVEEFGLQAGGSSAASGIPLAKLVPRVAQMGPLLLEEASKNRFIQIIRDSPDVELFFTLLYTNMPNS